MQQFSRRFTTPLTIALATSVMLAGCASSSKDIAASYVSPLAYNQYSCAQLAGELQRIVGRVHEVSGTVDSNSTNDKIAMGVGLILFWPALFMLKGDGPEQQELSMLKGEYDAVNQAAIRNNCGLVPGQPASSSPLQSASLGDANIKPDLGLTGSTITSGSTVAVSMNDPHGAFVSAVTREGCASKAGILPGDVIVAFNGHRVVSIEDLNSFVTQSQPGSTVKLDVYRKGVVLAVEAKL